ncbi:bile acid:sodium symporter family protein [Siansivirga zeaxanthinifaciens]|uniref:Membrane protein n=1 Tax=Siansivirga zeaxanthinifaciens CC-SAMT-1 TaxID=1454006 RepID=A0A0C5VW14_9FLAO|nr:bile acid:sodium symporter family protein [Siansivirga zeaxanthinifaciens]AJR03276.1 membrane protein [Siansivirga zeaxanthinifaciens CC-SAMT-1]
MKVKIDKFVIAIILTIGFAYFFPFWGTPNSNVPINTISTIGIFLIFFFYGLKLSPNKLKAGLKNWKLHILVQLATFLIFPLIVIVFKPLFSSESGTLIWLAFFFIAALPSTVSSSVVMVSIAKGNIPAAIFNASISGIIGVVITPLWMGLFLNNEQADFDFTSIYTKLIVQIILPVIFGVLLQRYFGAFAQKHSAKLTMFDKSIILLIIYKSFAESFYEGVFSSVSLLDLFGLLIAVISLFFVVYYLIGLVAKRLHFSLEDRITAQYCGTKKSLVHGTVFSKILFGNMLSLGIILLPLMLFHATQIVIVSFIASKLSKR